MSLREIHTIARSIASTFPSSNLMTTALLTLSVRSVPFRSGSKDWNMEHRMSVQVLVVGIVVDCSCGWRRQMPVGDPHTRSERIETAMVEHKDAIAHVQAKNSGVVIYLDQAKRRT